VLVVGCGGGGGGVYWGGGDAFERKFVCARDRVCACFSVYAYLLVLVCAHACVFPSVCVSVRV